MNNFNPLRLMQLGAAVVTTFFMLVLVGCSNEEPIPGSPTARGNNYQGRSLVLFYHEISKIASTPKDETSDYRNIQVVLGGDVVASENGWGTAEPLYAQSGDNLSQQRKELFEQLSTMNGDTTYIASVPLYRQLYHNQFLQQAAVEDIVKIEITATSDYNEVHRKGASLTDIANVTYFSIYPLVQERYAFNSLSTGNGAHPLYMEADSGFFKNVRPCAGNYNMLDIQEIIFHCKVSDVTTNPLKMTTAQLVLSLEEAPAQEAVIEVTVTIQMRGGEYPARTYKQTYKVK